MNIKRLTTAAIFLALHIILSFIVIIKLPNAGSITFISMVPLVFISLKFGSQYGIFTAFIASLFQMLFGFMAPPVNNLLNLSLVVLLDYIIAFTILGSANFFNKLFKNVTISIFIVCFIRFLCHFTSGIIIWNSFVPNSVAPWIYSLTYNASYMIPEAIFTIICSLILLRIFKSIKI